MADLNVNSIGDASGGNTASINGYTPTMSNMAGRNRIINGDMRIDARNAGASVTPTSSGYTLDRYQAGISQSSKFSVQQVLDAPTGFTKSLKVTSLAATSVGSGDYFFVQQVIEGNNVADLSFGSASANSITLSFWVKSSLTGTFGVTFYGASGTRSYPATYTVSSANTWEQKTVTITGSTTGTWITDTGAGLQVIFGLGIGSSLSGTAGSWANAGYLAPTGATSVVGTSGATLYITGVQLEAGSVATPFEHRQYGQELVLCQRYFEVVMAADGESFRPNVTAWSSQNANVTLFYKVQKRASPTITTSGGEVYNGSWLSVYSVNPTGFGSLNGINVDVLRASSYSPFSSYFFRNCTITASSEL